MRSEFQFRSQKWQVTFVLGFFLCVAIIVLSLIFRFEVGLILASIAFTIGAVGCVLFIAGIAKTIHEGKMRKLDQAKGEQELRILKAEADKAEAESYVLSFPNTHRLVTFPHSAVTVIDPVIESPAVATLPAGEEEPLVLLDLLKDIDRLFIRGGMRSGKTNLMLHLMLIVKIRTDQIFALDPHPNIWPAYTIRDFRQMELFLARVLKELDRRIDLLIAKPHVQLKPIYIFIDEVMEIVRNVDNYEYVFNRLSTAGGKTQINIIAATQSQRAKQIGLSGVMDLLSSYVLVRTHKNQSTGKYSAWVDFGVGEQEAIPPGPYNHHIERGKTIYDLPDNGALPILEAPAVDPKVQQWVELVQGGMSKNKATQQVFDRQFAGDLVEKLNNALNGASTTSTTSTTGPKTGE